MGERFQPRMIISEIGRRLSERYPGAFEAGKKAWESIYETKDRLVGKVSDAIDKLGKRFEKPKEETKARVLELSNRAAIFGLTKIAEPIENRLQQIYEIPAAINEWKARRASTKSERLNERIGETREDRDEAIAAEREYARDLIATIKLASAAAKRRAEGLREEASKRREAVSERFGKVRRLVKSLETK